MTELVPVRNAGVFYDEDSMSRSVRAFREHQVVTRADEWFLVFAPAHGFPGSGIFSILSHSCYLSIKNQGEIAGKDMKLTNFRASALDKAPESPYNDPYSRVKTCGI